MKKNFYLRVKGVGIDLIRINRISRVYRRRPEQFLNRIFSEREVNILLNKRGNLLPSIAARFAAKEAVSKALGCGIGVVRWSEIEILPGNKKKPKVFLKGNAARWSYQYGIKGVFVSMSHDGPFAVAKAIAYGD